jgi:molybdate transport system substrate-binding protein
LGIRVLRKWGLALAALACLIALGSAQAQRQGPVVLAAASLQEALTAAADRWAAKGNPRPVLSFAASSALARQIAAGAPADLFLSADEAWMDDLARRGLLRANTRAAFLTNRLVLIAPASSKTRLKIGQRFALRQALGSGRLALADPQAVPAGRYARAALTRLGVWQGVAGRLAPSENVRAALTLVERGETPLGIVYATDARASSKVRVVDTFSATSHPPITYPMALIRKSGHRDAEPFRRFLLSREGKAIFARHGFGTR